jgi:glycosyltransferase involved in cell wall biosynthesis
MLTFPNELQADGYAAPTVEADGSVAEVSAADRMPPKRKVLVVAYIFPPVGGAGVQRVLKFVKYLRKHGWEPTVLTVANPSVPVIDESLAGDVPSEVRVVRAKSWEPSYAVKAAVTPKHAGEQSIWRRVKQLGMRAIRSCASIVLQPDSQMLWYPAAVAAGKRLLRKEQFDAILVTAPPYSSLLVGRALARASKVPLVVDYRDEWTISNDQLENKQLGPFARFLQRGMENRVLRTASGVVATTEASAESLRGRCREANASAPVYCIYNGFDADDFRDIEPAARDSRLFRVVYMGTLWNLTSLAPFKEAVATLSKTKPDLARRLEVVIVGRRVGKQVALVEELQRLSCRTIVQDYLEHSTVLGYLASADATLLLLSDAPGAERVVPAKLFEYAASGCETLAIVPQGETWKLLDKVSGSTRFEPRDVGGVARWLESRLSLADSLNTRRAAPPPGFDRDTQTAQLAEILLNVTSKR